MDILGWFQSIYHYNCWIPQPFQDSATAVINLVRTFPQCHGNAILLLVIFYQSMHAAFPVQLHQNVRVPEGIATRLSREYQVDWLSKGVF